MGATTFGVSGRGKTAKEAFDALVEKARHDLGHGGYTGSIAEKREFVMIGNQPLSGVSAALLATQMIDTADPRIVDKYGPAGCIPIQHPDPAKAGTVDRWFFFGWAAE